MTELANRRGATTAELKDAIDRGRTGDKIHVLDAAAAPLGTDDEAAGTPPRPEAIAGTLRRETSRVSRLAAAANDTREVPSPEMYAGQTQRRRSSPVAIAIGVALAFVVAYALIQLLG